MISKIPRLRREPPDISTKYQRPVQNNDQIQVLAENLYSLHSECSSSISNKTNQSGRTLDAKKAHSKGASQKFHKYKNVCSKYATYANPKNNLALKALATRSDIHEDDKYSRQILELENKIKTALIQKQELQHKTQQDVLKITEHDKQLTKLKITVEEMSKQLQKEKANFMKEEQHHRACESELRAAKTQFQELRKQEKLQQAKLKELKVALGKIRAQHGAKCVFHDNSSDELVKVIRTHESEILNVQSQVDSMNNRLEKLRCDKDEKDKFYKMELDKRNKKLEELQHELIRTGKSRDEAKKLYIFLRREIKQIASTNPTSCNIHIEDEDDEGDGEDAMSEIEMKTKILAFKMSLEQAQDKLVLYAKEKTRLIYVMSMVKPEDMQLHLSKTEKFIENLTAETKQLRKNIKFINNDLQNKSQLIRTLQDNLNIPGEVEHRKLKYIRNILLTKMKESCEIEQNILRLKFSCKMQGQKIEKNKYLISVRDNLLFNADKTIKQMDTIKSHFRLVIDQHYLMSLKFNRNINVIKNLRKKLTKVKAKAKHYENKLLDMKVNAMLEDTTEEWTELTEVDSLEAIKRTSSESLSINDEEKDDEEQDD